VHLFKRLIAIFPITRPTSFGNQRAKVTIFSIGFLAVQRQMIFMNKYSNNSHIIPDAVF